MKKIIAAAIFAVSFSANSQELACTKIGFEPGTPDPNKCATVIQEPYTPAKKPAPTPAKPAAKPPAQVAQPEPADVPEVDFGDMNQSSQLRKDAFSGIAQSAALVLLLPSSVGKSTLNLGAANYGGQSAIGLTFAHRTNSLVLSAGASVGTSGQSLVRVGAGFEF